MIYQDQGRSDEAEKIYLELVRKHPDYAAAWVNLASIREQAGDLQESERLFRRAVEAIDVGDRGAVHLRQPCRRHADDPFAQAVVDAALAAGPAEGAHRP